MILLGTILIMISAIAEAVMDTISHRFSESIFKDLNDDWWDPTFSWRNKYKDKSEYLGPKFWGSTTFFVFVTDAWHMFKMISKEGFLLGLAFLSIGIFNLNFWDVVILFTVVRSFYGFIFHLNYSNLFRRL
jgi:hypothetical protein